MRKQAYYYSFTLDYNDGGKKIFFGLNFSFRIPFPMVFINRISKLKNEKAWETKTKSK